MSNVTSIRLNYRGTEVEQAEPYVKYEIYVPKKHEAAVDTSLLNEEWWTWLTKSEVEVI